MWALSTCSEPNEITKNTHPMNITALSHGQDTCKGMGMALHYSLVSTFCIMASTKRPVK